MLEYRFMIIVSNFKKIGCSSLGKYLKLFSFLSKSKHQALYDINHFQKKIVLKIAEVFLLYRYSYDFCYIF